MAEEAVYSDYLKARAIVARLQKKVSRQASKVNHLGTGYKKLCHLQDQLEVAQSTKTEAMAKLTENRRGG